MKNIYVLNGAPNQTVICILIKIPLSLEKYIASLCFEFCWKKKPWKQRDGLQYSLNKIEITWNIYKDLYSLVFKNHHTSLSASRIFTFCLTLINIRLFHWSYLNSICILSSFSALLCIAEFLLIWFFFVSWFIKVRIFKFFL